MLQKKITSSAITLRVCNLSLSQPLCFDLSGMLSNDSTLGRSSFRGLVIRITEQVDTKTEDENVLFKMSVQTNPHERIEITYSTVRHLCCRIAGYFFGNW